MTTQALPKVIVGLFIPANWWVDVKEVELPLTPEGEVGFERLRELIGCRTIEVISPTGTELPGMGDSYTIFGDEEGRFPENPVANLRATTLFRYPYHLVGDIVLIGRDELNGQDTDISMLLLGELQGRLP